MAETILTLPAGDALPPAVSVPPGLGGTLLAHDLRTTTGYALRVGDGAIVSGTVSLRLRRLLWATETQGGVR